MAVKKKRAPAKKAPAKRRTTVKKKAAPKKKSITRKSQATGKAPSKRLVARRKKTARGPAGYFANPIKGTKAARFYAAYVLVNGERYYYGGSRANGAPIFDTDIKKAFIAHEKTPMVNHVKAEARQHIRHSGLKMAAIRVYIDEKGQIIPGE